MLKLIFLFLAVCASNIYDHTKSSVTRLTHLNFDKIVTKAISSTKYVQIVHFYKPMGMIYTL